MTALSYRKGKFLTRILTPPRTCEHIKLYVEEHIKKVAQKFVNRNGNLVTLHRN